MRCAMRSASSARIAHRLPLAVWHGRRAIGPEILSGLLSENAKPTANICYNNVKTAI